MLRKMSLLLALIAGLIGSSAVMAEDGYDLWLRYRPIEATAQARYSAVATQLVVGGRSPTLDAAAGELRRGLSAMLRRPLPIAPQVSRDGAILIGTPGSSPAIAGLGLKLRDLGDEGYLIRSLRMTQRRPMRRRR